MRGPQTTGTVTGQKYWLTSPSRVVSRFCTTISLFRQRIMPQRRPLRELSGNRRDGNELISIQRAEVDGVAKCGVSYANVSRMLGFAPSTVRRTYDLSTQQNLHESLLRAGRPSITSKRDRRTVIRYARFNPKATYAQLRIDLQILLSDSTIKRILLPFHLRKWRCRKRLGLTPEVAKLRYQWVLLRKDWSVKEWASIIFSDDSSVERVKGGQREWVWRTATRK